MSSKFKVLLKQFCTESTMLGLKYFYIYPDKVTKCFWALATLGSFCFALLLTAALWLRFEQQPTRISIETQFADIKDLPYPAVTICSPNQISKQQVKHFKKTLVDGNNTGLDFNDVLPQLLGYHELVPYLDNERLDQLHRLMMQNRYTVREVMSIIPQPCKRFIKFCLFELKKVDCEKFFRPILTQYGLCCIFNSPYVLWENLINFKEHNFTPVHPSPASRDMIAGLTVVVDTEDVDAMNGTLLNVGGIRVMFHDYTEFPSDDESFIIQPHVESFQLIKGVHTYCSSDVGALAPESRRCVFPHESDKGLIRNYYRNSDCDWMCFVDAILTHCHCWLLSTPGFHNNLCNFTDIKCIIDTKRILAQTHVLNDCHCPRDCDSRVYKVILNIGNLGALPYLNVNPFRDIKFNRSTALLHFINKNNFYVIQKQETIMSYVNLLSNLGGVYGLCMGCSLLTVLEIFFFIYRLLKIIISSCRRSKVHHHKR